MRKNNINISSDWAEKLSQEFTKPYFVRLISYISEEEENFNVYPEKEIRFEALNKTSFKNTRVVIIGQDPYHAINQANGLAFSVNKKIKKPPSLKNILKELSNDLKLDANNTNLNNWARQGVLLLNSILTVRENKAASHREKGWEVFTDKIIEIIAQKKKGIIFILWGNYAIKKIKNINLSKHFILKSAHPSPLSSYRGFFGCQHFSKTNKILKTLNKKPIEWI